MLNFPDGKSGFPDFFPFPTKNYFPALFIRFPALFIRFSGFFRFRSNPENSFPPESLTLGPPRRCFCACLTASLRVPAGHLRPAAQLTTADAAPPELNPR